VPLVAPRFDSRALWVTTWGATYRAELRSERPDVVETLYGSAPERYERVTRLAVTALPYPVTWRSDRGRRDGVRGAAVGRRLSASASGVGPARRPRQGPVSAASAAQRSDFRGRHRLRAVEDRAHSGVEIDRTWRQKRHRLLALGAEAVAVVTAPARSASARRLALDLSGSLWHPSVTVRPARHAGYGSPAGGMSRAWT